jgi:hypothetical protein
MSTETLKVGILGSGDVGKALAVGFAEYGHSVTIGSRSPEKLQAWHDEATPGATADCGSIALGSFADAADFGSIIVLATLFTGTENAIRLAGSDRFAGNRPPSSTATPTPEGSTSRSGYPTPAS